LAVSVGTPDGLTITFSQNEQPYIALDHFYEARVSAAAYELV
jgi:hypothetical protein